MDIAKSLFGNRPHEGYAGREDYNVSLCSNPYDRSVFSDLFPKKHVVYTCVYTLLYVA
jgi:hypothetical protein